MATPRFLCPGTICTTVVCFPARLVLSSAARTSAEFRSSFSHGTEGSHTGQKNLQRLFIIVGTAAWPSLWLAARASPGI